MLRILKYISLIEISAATAATSASDAGIKSKNPPPNPDIASKTNAQQILISALIEWIAVEPAICLPPFVESNLKFITHFRNRPTSKIFDRLFPESSLNPGSGYGMIID